MLINAEELNKAIEHVALIASMDKAQPGILFNIQNDSIEVYYNTAQKAIKKNVSAIVSEEEFHGQAVFDYKRLTDTIATCKPSGQIKVGDIEMVLKVMPDNSGLANVRVVKTMEFQSGEDSTEDRVVSTNNYELSWWSTEQLSVKQKILTNPACEDMFNEVDAETWDTEELCRAFNDASTGDAKIVYMTSKYDGVFAVNTSSVVYVKTRTTPGKIMQLQASCVKALVSIFNSLGEDVQLNTISGADGKLFACLFFTPDHKTSVYLAATDLISAQVASMGRYHGISYTSYQASMMTSVLKDTLKSATSISSSANINVKFSVAEDGGVDATIKAENTGASVSNTYNIRCTSFNSSVGIDENADSIFSFSINLKQLYDIVNCNKLDYTGIDVFKDSNRVYLRIGFFAIEDSTPVREAVLEAKRIILRENGASDDAINSVKLTTEDKMNMREDYISSCYYATATA